MTKAHIIALTGIAFFLAMAAEVNARVRITTTTPDAAAIAKTIGGRHVVVTSLTRGVSDPHYLTARPSMIHRVFRSDLLIIVGADLEAGWLPAVLEAGRNAKVRPGGRGHLDLSRFVKLRNVPTGTVSRAQGDVHLKGDPHYHLDPANGLVMASAIAGKLAELDPDNARTYSSNLRAFHDRLRRRIADWRSRLVALRGRPVVTYHRSFRYLAAAFGFRVISEIEPLPGIAPTASHLIRLVKRIKSQRVGLVLSEAFRPRQPLDFVRRNAGVAVVIIPHSVAPSAGIKTYTDLFERIVSAVEKSGTAGR